MTPASHAVGFMMRVETDDEVLLAKPCIICGQSDCIQSTLVCDMCHNVAHVDCLGLTAVPRDFGIAQPVVSALKRARYKTAPWMHY